MKQELIAKKINWKGDRNHYLYTETPRIVKGKITNLMDLEKKDRPVITSGNEEQYGKFIYQADVMLYPTETNKTEAGIIYQELTTAIAILAFVSGGVDMFGWHYEVLENGIRKT